MNIKQLRKEKDELILSVNKTIIESRMETKQCEENMIQINKQAKENMETLSRLL